MGGTGSGFRGQRKLTVEESFSIRMTDFYRRRRSRASGTLTWTSCNCIQCRVQYVVEFQRPSRISLEYRRGDDAIRLLIYLQTTETKFDGDRWWFTPLKLAGVGSVSGAYSTSEG